MVPLSCHTPRPLSPSSIGKKELTKLAHAFIKYFSRECKAIFSLRILIRFSKSSEKNTLHNMTAMAQKIRYNQLMDGNTY